MVTPPLPRLSSSPAGRSSHSAAVLRGLRGSGELTLSELARSTGLSRPTLALAIDGLVGEGWVETLAGDDDPGKSAGRPPRRYRFRADSAVIAGVDVGVGAILVLLADLNEKIVAEFRQTLPHGLPGADRVDAVVDSIAKAMALVPSQTVLLAAAIGAPGIIDDRGRIMACPPIRSWDGIDLTGQLVARLRCPIFVENDAMAAAVGENRYGAGRGTRDFVFVLADHRISSASIINGLLHRGFTGAAGVLGELDESRWNSAETRLSARLAGWPDGPLSASELFESAAEGNAAARRAVDDYLDDLAVGLSAVVLTVDPELVVVGGAISLAGEEVAVGLRERLARHVTLVSPRVEMSTLGNRATAAGAMGIGFRHLDLALAGSPA
jgi:predicted NBD/HSP70 family sugar kinase